MATSRVLVIALLLTLAFALGPVAVPTSATHSCVDDVPCYPHPPNEGPKEIIQHVAETVRCLVLAQPPTACI